MTQRPYHYVMTISGQYRGDTLNGTFSGDVEYQVGATRRQMLLDVLEHVKKETIRGYNAQRPALSGITEAEERKITWIVLYYLLEANETL